MSLLKYSLAQGQFKGKYKKSLRSIFASKSLKFTTIKEGPQTSLKFLL